MDQYTKRIVSEIVRRIAQRLGADGRKGNLLVALSGAAEENEDAISQLRALVFDGFQLLIVFCGTSNNLSEIWLEDRMLGMPFVRQVAAPDWQAAFADARAVLVPLLNLKTAATVSALIGQSVLERIMLHALAGGKPIIAAPTGYYSKPDRFWSTIAGAGTAFQKAALERLQVLEDFGCRLADVAYLCEQTRRVLDGLEFKNGKVARCASKTELAKSFFHSGQTVVTAGHIRQARDRGVNLRLVPGAVVTPLAREMAVSLGIKLVNSE